MTAREVVDARKVRLGRDELMSCFAVAERVLVAKGEKVAALEFQRSKPTADELAAAVLGPSGNLRAPTIRVGHTFVVGFAPDLWRELLGA
ncbi:MAG: hypothetical protein IT454_10385 [Planctomycetes bacterium]|nr:hypothetical protein [Planctomycetota bacterium]